MECMKPYHKKHKDKEKGSKRSSPSPEVEEEYEVKAIIDHHNQKNGHKYKVHWVGYTTQDNPWANQLVQDYLNSHRL
ncbi:uncharacterized protein ACA1_047670 [Acanthamoeba castellanii str. Neff]|uniref:Chromo domain-containing protein n=1 Tax=Acanthamoeba castellanii (strain ATCC 30010 / Neff) TaxID=1257118 RepID=L8GTW6_ACACF|nr:uncharacterized protein ACA1_047670 [Acanthamoeba castellanii str. Neff]ELR16387.1 hypothetical protein ACA1_047670 [Acanthamoeba castellanii str. Neff]